MTNFDPYLEHAVTVILKLPLIHPLAVALLQTFDDFRTIDTEDGHEFRYTLKTDPPNH
jgi:hypothetical protein